MSTTMEDALGKRKKLYHQLNQLQHVLGEFIAYNESCFVNPIIYQIETYQIRRRRCFRIMRANEDQSEFNQLQITLENVSKELETLTLSAFENSRQRFTNEVVLE